MVNTPADRSPDSSESAAPPDKAVRPASSSDVAGGLDALRSKLSAMGSRLRQALTSLFTGESPDGVRSGRERNGGKNADDEARSDILGSTGQSRSPSRPVDADGDGDDDRAGSRGVTTLAVADAPADPPEHPKAVRLKAERTGDSLSLSEPGNPEAYVSSTEWVPLER